MNLTKTNYYLQQAYEEIVELINEAYEYGEFNNAYFEKPFREWFAKKMDEFSSQ